MHAIVSKKRKKESYKPYEILAAVKPPTSQGIEWDESYLYYNYVTLVVILHLEQIKARKTV